MGQSNTSSSKQSSGQLSGQRTTPDFLSQNQQQSVNNILSAMPVDSEERTRLAGQIFNPFDSQKIEDTQSYSDVSSKLKDSKYQRIGTQSGTDMSTSSYTG